MLSLTSDNLIAYFYVVDKQKLLTYFMSITKSSDNWAKEYKDKVDKYTSSEKPTMKGLIDTLSRKYFVPMGINVVFQRYENDLQSSEWQTEYGKSESENCLKNR